MVEKARQIGFQYEKDYQNCCQSTIAAIQDTLGIHNDDVFKAGSGMAGGVGIHCDGVCGGYSGGVMVLSQIFGRERRNFEDTDALMSSFELASQLHEKYIQEYGTVICAEIHQKIFGRTFDLWQVEDFEAIEELGAHKNKCTGIVGNASAWTIEIILNEIEKRGDSLEEL
jgi:C_GCAxxG_C_C family probable redox protein